MNRIRRKQAQTMDELIENYIREMKIASGLNTQLVFSAWDSVSGVSAYTIGRFYRDGVLYITLNSSMVRNGLLHRKSELIHRMNEILVSDALFVKDNPRAGLIKELVLR